MKKLLVCILILSLSFASVAFGASVIRNAYFNGDLKLVINGNPVDIRIVTVELEGEQYGRNYYSIADLVKALNDYGGISAKVDFDSNTKTTIVEIGQSVTSSVYDKSSSNTTIGQNTQVVPTPIPTPTPLPPEYIPNQNQTEEGGEPTNMQSNILTNITDYIVNENGEQTFMSNEIKYITGTSVAVAVNKNPNLAIMFQGNNKSYIYKRYTMNIMLANIPNKVYEDTNGNKHSCFEYDYYINTLLPFIEQWTE